MRRMDALKQVTLGESDGATASTNNLFRNLSYLLNTTVVKDDRDLGKKTPTGTSEVRKETIWGNGLEK